MTLLLLQGDLSTWNWSQFGMAAGAVFIVIAFLIFVLKIVPGLAATYEKIKLAEIGVREEETKTRSKEAESRTQQANGFSQLAQALSQMSGVLRDVVIEQRHATDKAILLGRVNAEAGEQVMTMMNDISGEITSLREAIEVKTKNGTQEKSSPTA